MGRGPGVRAASKTSIQIDFRYRGARCRERVKLDPAAGTSRNFGKQLKARIEHEIALGTFDYAHHFPDSPRARKFAQNPSTVVTVGELLTDWLKSVRAQIEPETYGDYAEYVARTWRPLFGARPLSQLTLALVNDWIAGNTASRKRILNVLTPLRQAVRYACSPGIVLLKSDPLAGLEVIRPERVQEEDIIDPFTPAEVAGAAAQLDAQTANLVTLWAWTGLRQGEIFALTWPDVDFERKIARINKSRRAGRLKAVKTRAGVREIRLLPPALEALQRQREHTQLMRREVFLRPDTGEAWGPDKPFRLVWTAALAAAGVRYRFPRQLRHTFASWMLGSGENPLWVSKHMGHANPAITLNVYSRLIPDMYPDAGMRAVREIQAKK
jgi:integrase